MVKFRFYELDVWRKSIDFATTVYATTAEFPQSEQYGLVRQLRRAAVSISANIAEGSGRTSDRDFARFIEIAYGSLMETVSHLCISLKQDFLQRNNFDSLTVQADELARMLSGLRKSLESHVT